MLDRFKSARSVASFSREYLKNPTSTGAIQLVFGAPPGVPHHQWIRIMTTIQQLQERFVAGTYGPRNREAFAAILSPTELQDSRLALSRLAEYPSNNLFVITFSLGHRTQSANNEFFVVTRSVSPQP
ncbi:hypothetical protein NP233_g1998 [Leucocoprinus birnbaumii]|uniref:Uncharacterized protein n=1 Tax=Leucocoprinus birnbaumii TaxID=56174 RepID=A0AAD5YXJ9_9AGAR|nr:hypothetical protein NP233_g1998 [Leucocoprinus birnbaumii]